MFANALLFLAGHCIIAGLPSLPPHLPMGLVLGLAVLALAITRLPAAAWLPLGALWAGMHAHYVLAHDLKPALEGQDLEVTGWIASIPELTTSGPRFLLDLDGKDAPDADLPSRVEITWYDSAVVPRPGELWQFTVRLRRRHGFANPGGHDYEGQLFRERIGATGYVREEGSNRRIAQPATRYLTLRLRGHIASLLAAALAGHPMLGIVQGLAIGEPQGMTAEQWRIFAATGTSHLMAISGLHIAMVAALSAQLGAWLVHLPGMQRRRFNASDGRALGCIVGAGLYAVLAGFGVPAQRTFVMICVYCGSRLLRRELTLTQGLALALFAVLLVDPFAPLSVGAWLSFGAVAAISLLLAGRLRVRVPDSWRAKVGEFLKVQWAVTIGLLPLLVFAFGSVSLVAPLVNLVAIPYFTLVVVPIVLLGAAASLVSVVAGQWLLSLASAALSAAWPVLETCANLDFALWHLPVSPFWVQGLLLVGAALIIAPGTLATRLAGVLLCLPAAFWRPPMPEAGEFRLTVLDVGQGLASVVVTRSHVLLYDAGPAFRSGRDTGQMVVLPYLRAKGIDRLDAVVVSHADLDHAGGVEAVVAGMQVGAVLASYALELKDIAVTPCIRGSEWEWDGVTFTILHPSAGTAARSENNASCVLRISGHGGSALLLGDVERAAEIEMGEAGLLQPASVVVAPHHGSRTSSTPELVYALDARYVMFAAGYRNRWGFPRPDVVQRWKDSGAEAFSTASSGAIEVLVGRSAVNAPVTFRQDRRRFWHASDP